MKTKLQKAECTIEISKWDEASKAPKLIKVKVPGYKYGIFYIHRPYGQVGSWTITHPQTGAAVAQKVRTLQNAKEAAEMFISADLDWDFTSLEDMPKSNALQGSVIRCEVNHTLC